MAIYPDDKAAKFIGEALSTSTERGSHLQIGSWLGYRWKVCLGTKSDAARAERLYQQIINRTLDPKHLRHANTEILRKLGQKIGKSRRALRGREAELSLLFQRAIRCATNYRQKVEIAQAAHNIKLSFQEKLTSRRAIKRNNFFSEEARLSKPHRRRHITLQQQASQNKLLEINTKLFFSKIAIQELTEEKLTLQFYKTLSSSIHGRKLDKRHSEVNDMQSCFSEMLQSSSSYVSNKKASPKNACKNFSASFFTLYAARRNESIEKVQQHSIARVAQAIFENPFFQQTLLTFFQRKTSGFSPG